MSAPFTFHSAASLVFGRGAVGQLGDIAARLKAKRVLVVTDAVLTKAGITEQALAPLRAAGLVTEVFAGCKPEPPVEVIREAADAARKFAPDLLVGLGGGSNMDAAISYWHQVEAGSQEDVDTSDLRAYLHAFVTL